MSTKQAILNRTQNRRKNRINNRSGNRDRNQNRNQGGDDNNTKPGRSQNRSNVDKSAKLPGFVRDITSGDTIVIIPLEKSENRTNGPPTTFNLTLMGITAPRGESRSKDENGNWVTSPADPYYFQSREFLRRRLIGKTVIYRAEHKTKTGRVFGEVWLPGPDGRPPLNIRYAIIRSGLATVTRKERLEDPSKDNAAIRDYKEMLRHQAFAVSKQVGMHDPSTNGSSGIRKLNFTGRDVSQNYKPAIDLFEKYNSLDEPLHGIVERVFDGHSIRVLIAQDRVEIALNLAGIKCPRYSSNEANCEPYALEAKFFTEQRLLLRDVSVVIETIDNNNNFYGTVTVRETGYDATEDLIKRGLAEVVEWTVSANADLDELLRCQAFAQKKRFRIWNSGQSSSGRKGTKEEFDGTVVEVANGGTIIVRSPTGDSFKDRRVMFSSVSLPRGNDVTKPRPPKDADDEAQQRRYELELEKYKEDVALRRFEKAHSIEAKEFLRKLVIGKHVICTLDYEREQHNGKNMNRYYTVSLRNGQNIACALLRRGLAKVVSHYQNEKRSPQYRELLSEQNIAVRNNVGLHGPTDRVPVRHFNDYTGREKSKKGTYDSMLKHLSKFESIDAVVDYVFRATSFKLTIPSQNCIISFSLEGFFSPKSKSVKGKGLSIYQRYPPNDNVGNQGVHFARSLLFQRDVKVRVSDVSASGNFLGQLYINGKEYILEALAAGFATIQRDASDYFYENKMPEYENAKRVAKQARLGVWADYDESKVLQKRKEQDEEKKLQRQQAKKPRNIYITEVVDGCNFYYQIVGAGSQQLVDLMKDIREEDFDSLPQITPEVGDKVCALFSQDNNWYRGVVKSIKNGETPLYNIFFYDYGNKELLPAENIRALPNAFSLLEPQARAGKLAFIKSPLIDESYGVEARDFFRHLCWDKELLAKVHGENPDQLSIGDPELGIHLSAAMVIAGLARVESSAAKQLKIKQRKANQKAKNDKSNGKEVVALKLYNELQYEQNIALADHRNIWEHGALPDSDEEKELQRMDK
eukprot:TRINITY_DN280_c0_g1_i1.p1 TRINITY_DN280_c0_g1~~TRINITY_DN280_c0_g1_i1.p1  ORF type:complete len:1032 (-),score=308.34 TRINITY_DN280_c0_g1_i1:62-3157(-)